MHLQCKSGPAACVCMRAGDADAAHADSGPSQIQLWRWQYDRTSTDTSGGTAHRMIKGRALLCECEARGSSMHSGRSHPPSAQAPAAAEAKLVQPWPNQQNTSKTEWHVCGTTQPRCWAWVIPAHAPCSKRVCELYRPQPLADMMGQQARCLSAHARNLPPDNSNERLRIRTHHVVLLLLYCALHRARIDPYTHIAAIRTSSSASWQQAWHSSMAEQLQHIEHLTRSMAIAC